MNTATRFSPASLTLLLAGLLRPASPLPRAQHLALARLADYLTSRREAEQLAADPTLRAARREAAAHFGPKAQNSLAPLPEA